jgi:hypothetical protein
VSRGVRAVLVAAAWESSSSDSVKLPCYHPPELEVAQRSRRGSGVRQERAPIGFGRVDMSAAITWCIVRHAAAEVERAGRWRSVRTSTTPRSPA